jgi:SAM-dependent methyltransferase
MRIPQSDMPAEEQWESFLDVPTIISRLDLAGRTDVAELGCGYGTFTSPLGQTTKGTFFAFDIDPVMVARTRQRTSGLPVQCEERDVVEAGFGVTVDAVLLFNVLQGEPVLDIFRHAVNSLRDGGEVLVVQWHYALTPYGPTFDIRPRPDDLVAIAERADLVLGSDVIDLPPWHYGLRFEVFDTVVLPWLSS